MKITKKRIWILLPVLLSLFSFTNEANEERFKTQIASLKIDSLIQDPSLSLCGLWEAKRDFDPGVKGALIIKRSNGVWSAEISGNTAPVKVNNDSIRIELPDQKGKFAGTIAKDKKSIFGFWFQYTVTSGTMAMPITLVERSPGRWEGEVIPCPDEITFYLMIKERGDGTIRAFLRNPERNIGRLHYPIDDIELDGQKVMLFAAAKENANENEKGKLLTEGIYDSIPGMLSIQFPRWGGTYNFRRTDPGENSYFYPRGMQSYKYKYSPPLKKNDGWEVSTLEKEGISVEAIEKFIQLLIDNPIDSINSPEDHGILIARHGKLVLEEYFHGENGDKVHDTRSATKSIAADMMGAAIYNGIQVSTSDSVYKIMNNGRLPEGLDPRKSSLLVKHLLTMTSGYDCDDNDPGTPGYEDNMWEMEEPDFYKKTLELNMVRDPGSEPPVYCSANPNLVGGVLAKASNESSLLLFHNLLAKPLGISNYYLLATPTETFAIQGSGRFLPRDFMKLAQVHLNGGTWNGKRIYTPEWSKESTTPYYYFGNYKQHYSYLWWMKEFTYKGRSVWAYYASGNGGQSVMAIPELDLVLAFYGGNYNSPGGSLYHRVYVPEYILPAIK